LEVGRIFIGGLMRRGTEFIELIFLSERECRKRAEGERKRKNLKQTLS